MGIGDVDVPSHPMMSKRLFAERISSRPTSKYDTLKCPSAYLFQKRPIIIPGPIHTVSILLLQFDAVKNRFPQKNSSALAFLTLRMSAAFTLLWKSAISDACRILYSADSKLCVFAVGASTGFVKSSKKDYPPPRLIILAFYRKTLFPGVKPPYCRTCEFKRIIVMAANSCRSLLFNFFSVFCHRRNGQ